MVCVDGSERTRAEPIASGMRHASGRLMTLDDIRLAAQDLHSAISDAAVLRHDHAQK